jgi:hypothetical protein
LELPDRGETEEEDLGALYSVEPLNFYKKQLYIAFDRNTRYNLFCCYDGLIFLTKQLPEGGGVR